MPRPPAPIPLKVLESRVEAAAPRLAAVRNQLRAVVVGQEVLLDRLLAALLARGHVLLEGYPGLGKSLAVRALAASLDARFSRIQFTPDLLPSDLIGTLIYNPRSLEFEPRLGPVFANVVLADEINRAPAKVQSALLEAMEERQVTLGNETRQLEPPFLVLATQNPLEQEGTYPLPEAQLDRFLFKLSVTYPAPEQERALLDRPEARQALGPAVMDKGALAELQDLADTLHVDPRLKDYVLAVVHATRPADGRDARIRCGASPRAALGLLAAARAHALLQGRAFVIPDDVKSLARDVLRHRVLLRYEAEAEGITADSVVTQILRDVPVP